ncbi:MAG: SusC/RagA family TonB-linked outer membrane protein [Prevotellaceae bacterium]|jgi:TonB-linked SusC/RagA family outer membrane protein|nr:SusC/RagA family TonB-linked outer membrane protein [Prevotellaceae bacterium]
MAQTATITGTVVDDIGEVLAGVSVTIKGTTVGTVTNKDGKFTVDVPANNKVLIFTFVGMKTVETEAVTDMRIVMHFDSEELDNVVITGITTTDKRLFTGAANKLVASDIALSGIPEISRALEGRSAGLSVQNVSGTFGTAPKIRVRGATSIYGDSKPLWIVDGVPLEDVVSVTANDLSSGNAETLISSAISGLNADDIESFDILKDGSATSIYGARAMAGVIVVTTKRGRAGASSFNYTGEFTSRLAPSYRNFNIMNSQEQMSVYQEMQQKGWLNHAEIANESSSGIYGKMYQLINTYDPVTEQFGLANTPEARAAYLRAAEYRNTDWFDKLFSSTITQNHSVSMQAGTEKSRYYASLSAMNDPGWSKSSSVTRYTGNLNASYKLFKNFELDISTVGSYRKQKAPGTLGQDVDVVYGEVKRDFDINPYSYALNTSRTMDPDEYYTRSYADFNILHELDNNYIDVSVLDVKFQAELKWKFLSRFEWSNLVSTRTNASSQEHHITDFSNQALSYRAMPTAVIRDRNPFLYSDPDHPYALPVTVLPEGGIYKRNDNKMTSFTYRSVLRYNETFNNRHIVNFNGGLEIGETRRHATWFRGWGLQYATGEIPFYAYQVFKKGAEEGSEYYGLTNNLLRTTAFFAQASYSWKGRYILSGTGRYEGSNKLGKSRSARWLPTWNVSGAWNIHEEPFFETKNSWLTTLTIRSSYSLTGDGGPSWLTNSHIVISPTNPWRPYSDIKETGLYINTLENPALTYEKKHEFNIGTNMGFINNRINLELDWYQRNNYDLIGPVATQGIGGEISKYGNVAEMKSNGLEISISSHNIKSSTPGGFNWHTHFIYTHTENKITALTGNQRLMNMVIGNGFAMAGYANNSVFSIPFLGLTEEGIPRFMNYDGPTISDIYFQRRDTGKGELDFLKYEGTSDPTDYGSLRNEFMYKGFRFNIFVTYSIGNVIRLDPVFKARYSDLTSMTKEYKNRWVNQGDEVHTDIPVILSKRQYDGNTSLQYAYNSYNYSTVRIAKGDFIRLKEVSLTYDFPKKWLSPIKLNSLSLKGQVTNLFLLYADKKLNGQDPEFTNAGGVAVPVPKQVTFTLRVGL